MPRRIPNFAALLLAAAFWMASASGQGLWDAGLMDGSWRNEFPSAHYGTPARPLSYLQQCTFPQVRFAFCPTTFVPFPEILQPQPVRSFSRSNWTRRVTNTRDQFWVVGANVEPALNSACNSGPPNQSEAVVAPFEGVFGLRVQPAHDSHRPYQNEVVMAVDLAHRPRMLESRPGCVTRDYIPYLGFGMSSERGGGDGALAVLDEDDAAPLLRFNYRLVDSNAEFFETGQAIPSLPRGQHSGLYVEAQWGGVRRWIWIELLNTTAQPESTMVTPWNWAIRESFHFPGAEIVLTSGPALQQECGVDGLQIPGQAPAEYSHRQPLPVHIDLQRLYDCVGHLYSTPLASVSGPVEITGVHFWVEVGVRERDGLPGLSPIDYDSRLGVAIDSIDLVQARGTPMSSNAELIDQMAVDLLGRAWSAAERDRWSSMMATHGRVPTIKAMLRSQDIARTSATSARLHALAFGLPFAREGFEASLAQLRAGARLDQVVDSMLARPDFLARYAGMTHQAFVRSLYRQALGGEIEALPDRETIEAAVGSVAYWVERLGSGVADRGDVLRSVFRLATARGLLQTEVETVVLYHSFFRLLPDSGGISAWRQRTPMPERLIEALYYAPTYRKRFTP